MARRRKITLLFHLKQNPDGTSLRVGLFAFGIISCRRHHLGVDPETAGTGSWVLRFIDCHPVPGWPRGSGKSSAQSSLPPAFVCTFYYTCSVLFRFFVLFGRKKNSSSRCVNCPLAGAGSWPLASSRWPSWSYYHRQQNQNQSLGNEGSRAPHPRQILIRKIVFEFACWIFNAQERTRALPWGTLRMSTKGLETEFEDSNGI